MALRSDENVVKNLPGGKDFIIAFRKRGVARIFQRGGHRGYSPDCHVDLHVLYHILSRHEGPY